MPTLRAYPAGVRAWLLVLAWVASLLLGGCGGTAPAAPGGGGGGPPRVVVLSPAVAVIVRDLGLTGLVVGRHAADMALPVSLPVCGDQNAIDVEMLRRLKPTHVYTQWGSRDLPANLVDRARTEGWTLREVNLMTLADVEREVGRLHVELAGAGAGDGPPRAGTMLREALTPRPLAARAGRVLLLGSVEPPGALGPGSCHHEVLERLGVRPAIEGGGPWQELSNEDLRRIAPDVIVLVLPRDHRAPPPEGGERARVGRTATGALGRLASLDLPAISSGRVVLIDHPLGLTPSTAMGEVARLLGDALEGLGAP
jgi:ABC-type Fe3+-hydroxamate transport system substrate-binding protein